VWQPQGGSQRHTADDSSVRVREDVHLLAVNIAAHADFRLELITAPVIVNVAYEIARVDNINSTNPVPVQEYLR